MKNIEFYTTPEGEVIIRPYGEPERNLEETETEFIKEFISVISEFYPQAYSALMEIYSASKLNRSYHDFLIVRRFIKCNFGAYDNIIDHDEHGNFKFEFVSCPLRGECKYDKIICSPAFNSKLSDRQMEVMKLIYDGLNDNEIADKLFISLNTVNNHRKNSFKKLGIHSIAEFMRLANRTNMFNH